MLDSSRNALIVGIDPGSTLGLCVIDMSGKSQGIFSFKDARLHDVINKILEFGMPVVISCDKKKIPSYISKVSRKLGCRIISPERDLLVSDKKRLVIKSGCSLRIDNSHQRDACASAFYAFLRLKSSIEKKRSFPTDLHNGALFKRILVDSETLRDVKLDLSLGKENGACKSFLKGHEKIQSEERFKIKTFSNNKDDTLSRIKQYKQEILRLKEEKERLFSRVNDIEKEIDIKARIQADKFMKRIESEKRLLSRINLEISKTNSELKIKIKSLQELLSELKIRLGDDDFEFSIVFFKSSAIRFEDINVIRNKKIFIREIDYLRDFALDIFKENDIFILYNSGLKKEISKLLDNDIKSLKVANIKSQEILGFAFFKKLDLRNVEKKNNFLSEIIDDYKTKRKRF